MKYKVGDKVKIRSDLVKNNWYGHNMYVSTMDNVKGEQTIRDIGNNGYLLYGDSNNYYWTDEMFEDIKEDNKMNNQNITINMGNLSQEERTTLLSLIKKANKPKSKVWKPEDNEKYYYSYSDCTIEEDTWDNAYEDRNRYAIGNCFKTREEAKFALEKQKVIVELKRFALEHNEEKIDWNNSKKKYYLYFNHEENCIMVSYYCINQYIYEPIYFTSETIAKQAIENIGEERIRKYYFEVDE